jgi:hypothetical protein
MPEIKAKTGSILLKEKFIFMSISLGLLVGEARSLFPTAVTHYNGSVGGHHILPTGSSAGFLTQSLHHASELMFPSTTMQESGGIKCMQLPHF